MLHDVSMHVFILHSLLESRNLIEFEFETYIVYIHVLCCCIVMFLGALMSLNVDHWNSVKTIGRPAHHAPTCMCDLVCICKMLTK